MNSLLSLKFIKKETILQLFDKIDRREFFDMAQLVLGAAFFEPSTRTRLGFEIAMSELSGTMVCFSDMHHSRCLDNYFQETLEDFAKVIAEMVDLLVIRHFENNVPLRLSNLINIPVINAGDGTNEHPTQALQDIWLMRSKAGSLDGKIIGFLGNISRSHRSIIFGLKHFNISKLLFLLPPNVLLPKDIEDFLLKNNIEFQLSKNLEDLLVLSDFINSFTPSVQDLKNKKDNNLNYIRILDDYIINQSVYKKTNSHAYILNAGPRTYEVATDMDAHPKFLFFEQVKTGILVKKGIISYSMQYKIEK